MIEGKRAAVLRVSVLAAWMLSAGDLHGAERGATGYEAPPECPEALAFDAEVEKRAPGTATNNARVAITGSMEAGYDGRLILEGRVREVHAETCGETVQALALAVAMAAMEDDDLAEGPEPSNVSSATPRAPEQPVERGPSLPASHLRPLLGVGVGAASGVGPGLAPGLAVFGALDLGGRSIRLGLAGARSGSVATDLGAARFTRVGAYVDGCPVSVRHGAFELAPCARFDGGLLRGAGESLENAESTALPWLAVSAGGRSKIAVTSALFVEAEARAVVPLLRHTFFVRPSETVFRIPAITAEAVIAAGFHFSK